MNTHERVIRGMLLNSEAYEEQIDGIIAYVEAVAGQAVPRPDTEQHETLSLANSKNRPAYSATSFGDAGLKPVDPRKQAEQPKRRERWYVWRSDGIGYISYQTEVEAATAADDINGTYSLMREVLPGDPSPEVVADVVRQLRGHCDYLRRNDFGGTAIQLDALADTLEGK